MKLLVELVRNPERSKRRFLRNLRIAGPDECWEWTGALNDNGRGTTNIGSSKMSVGRAAWAFEHGSLPPKEVEVCHKCDNGKCGNPRHLHLGSHKQNMAETRRLWRRRREGRGDLPRGIRRTRDGFQAYVWVTDSSKVRGGFQASRRFSHDASIEAMLDWREQKRGVGDSVQQHG
jgi:hypothetical protein